MVKRLNGSHRGRPPQKTGLSAARGNPRKVFSYFGGFRFVLLICQRCFAEHDFSDEQYESLIRQAVSAGLEPEGIEIMTCPQCEGAGQA
jgi:hypothetical protein